MTANTDEDNLYTRIWEEIPEPDNPFAASKCYCSGYDVYEDVLGNATWVEYLYLLIKQERPGDQYGRLLEDLAVALANPGPRDYSVRAAMSASVGGSTAASCLTAALAVGAGQYGGAREIYILMNNWKSFGQDIHAWIEYIENPHKYAGGDDIWPDLDHIPGFDLYGVSCATPVLQVMARLAKVSPGENLQWLQQRRSGLEHAAGQPLAMTCVVSAAFSDLDISPDEGEMLYLLLRLPGAAAHSLEQKLQWKKYPFFKDKLVLTNDPGE